MGHGSPLCKQIVQQFRNDVPQCTTAKKFDIKCKIVLRSDESTLQIVFGNHEHCILQVNEQKNPDCYQHKVQAGISDGMGVC